MSALVCGPVVEVDHELKLVTCLSRRHVTENSLWQKIHCDRKFIVTENSLWQKIHEISALFLE